LKEITHSEITSVGDAKLQYIAIHTASAVLIAIMIGWFFIQVCRNHPMKDNKCNTALIIIASLICFTAAGIGIGKVATQMGSSRESLDDKLNDIEPTTTSYQIIKNIDNDEKYFVPKDAKAKFDELSIDEMRKKKVYYESGYKLTKGETESDLTKYLGGKKAHEDLIANIKDIIESYKLMFIITAGIVLMAFILGFIIINLNKAADSGGPQPQNVVPQVQNINNNLNNVPGANNDNAGIINDSIGNKEDLNNAIDNIQPPQEGDNQNPFNPDDLE
jgi:hypothetical protein